MTFIVESPDGLPIGPDTFATSDAATLALIDWCKRYVAQGYYAAVTGRIPVRELPARCHVVEIVVTPPPTTHVTAGDLLDLLERAYTVIQTSEGADEHGEILTQLTATYQLLRNEIEGSHVGGGDDVVIIGTAPRRDDGRTSACRTVCQYLRDAYGVRATYEHPGYIAIPHDDGVSTWACGTANHQRWEAQQQHDRTGRVMDTRTTTVPETETNGFTIARALAQAIGLEVK